MAYVNKVILIGNVTRDPECRTFGNGGRVANFGLAVNSRRFNQQTGQWEDGDAMFIDCEAFNKGEFGKLADRVEQTLRKGAQVYLEGRLRLDQWDDKTSGQKRSKHKMVVESMQTFGPRADGNDEGRPNYNRGPAPARGAGPGAGGNYDNSSAEDYDAGNSGGGGANEEIPF
jgi:single-strand DNA-binding protein